MIVRCRRRRRTGALNSSTTTDAARDARGSGGGGSYGTYWKFSPTANFIREALILKVPLVSRENDGPAREENFSRIFFHPIFYSGAPSIKTFVPLDQSAFQKHRREFLTTWVIDGRPVSDKSRCRRENMDRAKVERPPGKIEDGMILLHPRRRRPRSSAGSLQI